MIEIEVSEQVDASADAIFEVLRSYREYAIWWPLRVRATPAGTADFEFFPFPFVRIAAREKKCIPGSLLEFVYIRGPFRGVGTWILSGTKGCTRVQYVVRLRPRNLLIALLARTPMFRWKHRRDVRGIIRNLGRRVRKK